MQNFYLFYFPLEKKYIKYYFRMPNYGYNFENKIRRVIKKLNISPPKNVVDKLLDELRNKI